MECAREALIVRTGTYPKENWMHKKLPFPHDPEEKGSQKARQLQFVLLFMTKIATMMLMRMTPTNWSQTSVRPPMGGIPHPTIHWSTTKFNCAHCLFVSFPSSLTLFLRSGAAKQSIQHSLSLSSDLGWQLQQASSVSKVSPALLLSCSTTCTLEPSASTVSGSCSRRRVDGKAESKPECTAV